MGVRTIANYAELLTDDKKLVGGLVSSVYDKTDALIGRVIPMRGYRAGSGIEIKINTSGNGSAEVYTEGQSMPAAAGQTVYTSTFLFKQFRVVVGETLPAMRARGPQGQGFQDGLPGDLDLMGAARDLKNLMTTTFTAAGQVYSLDGIIDDSGTYFGTLDRAVYTTLVSYKLDGSSAALSTSLLNKAAFRSKSSPYGARVELWLSEGIQEGAAAELASAKAAHPSMGGNVDLSPAMVSAANRPFVFLPGLATSIILGLTDVDGSWGYISNEQGNMAVEGSSLYWHQLGSQDSSYSGSLETAGLVYCTRPWQQIRIEALSVT